MPEVMPMGLFCPAQAFPCSHLQYAAPVFPPKALASDLEWSSASCVTALAVPAAPACHARCTQSTACDRLPCCAGKQKRKCCWCDWSWLPGLSGPAPGWWRALSARQRLAAQGCAVFCLVVALFAIIVVITLSVYR